MSCYHRFWEYHKANSLFPDWNFEFLIIGTFNPGWDFNSVQTASYFYGRTTNNYFWDVLPIVHEKKGLRGMGSEKWIEFLKEHEIGLTDLIINIHDADRFNVDHNCLLKSMQDKHLAKFKEVEFNTSKIIDLIEAFKLKKVFITNKTAPKFLEKEISKISKSCENNNVQFIRLMTPSLGARFRIPKGTKILDGILNDWKPKFSNE